jgi:hypothetical protein
MVLLAAVAALSACSEKAEDPAATEDTTAAPMPAETTAAATTAPGTYDVKLADGTMGTTVINADGTYVDTDAQGKEVRGTFASKDGKDCFDPEGDDPEECWTVTAPGPDGSFTATAADGTTTVTVTPRASATPAG